MRVRISPATLKVSIELNTSGAIQRYLVFYTIYKITHIESGKVYVGAHKTADLEDGYMGSGKLIQLAVAKYGVEAFHKEYLAVFDNANDMWAMEAQLVGVEEVQSSEFYNLKEGGDGGFDHLNDGSDSHIERTRRAGRKGVVGLNRYIKERRSRDPEFDQHCARLSREKLVKAKGTSSGFKGKTHSTETKKNIGRTNSEKQRGSKNSRFGTCWIHNPELKINKSIPLVELESFLTTGWIKGRKIKEIVV